MTGCRGKFNHTRFTAALDGARTSRLLTWRQVAAQAHVSPSTLSRLQRGKLPDADSLAALVAWAGLDVSDFTYEAVPQVTAEPLTQVLSLIHTDPALTPAASAMLYTIVKSAYVAIRTGCSPEPASTS